MTAQKQKGQAVNAVSAQAAIDLLKVYLVWFGLKNEIVGFKMGSKLISNDVCL